MNRETLGKRENWPRRGKGESQGRVGRTQRATEGWTDVQTELVDWTWKNEESMEDHCLLLSSGINLPCFFGRKPHLETLPWVGTGRVLMSNPMRHDFWVLPSAGGAVTVSRLVKQGLRLLLLVNQWLQSDFLHDWHFRGQTKSWRLLINCGISLVSYPSCQPNPGKRFCAWQDGSVGRNINSRFTSLSLIPRLHRVAGES